ncbi:MAG TPA: hypothetical protein V6D08_17810, partial [Candidatus Obscuribacterales bacterium]
PPAAPGKAAMASSISFNSAGTSRLLRCGLAAVLYLCVSPPASGDGPDPPPLEQANGAAPGLAERPPLPEPPDVFLPPPRRAIPPKRPLAWRAKAGTMAGREATEPRPPAGIADLVLACPADEAFLSAIAACQQVGITIESIDSGSGEILGVMSTSSPSRIILRVRGAAPGRTSVSAVRAPGSRPLPEAPVKQLLSTLERMTAANRSAVRSD